MKKTEQLLLNKLVLDCQWAQNPVTLMVWLRLWALSQGGEVKVTLPLMEKATGLSNGEVRYSLNKLKKAGVIVPIGAYGNTYKLTEMDELVQQNVQLFSSKVCNSLCNFSEGATSEKSNSSKEKSKKVCNSLCNFSNQSSATFCATSGGEKNGDKAKHQEEAQNIKYDGVMQTWNTMFDGVLPTIQSLDAKRRRAIKSRVAEHGKQALMDVFRKTKASSFLCGYTTDFKASFDWVLRPTNFVKIKEGNYDNGKCNYSSGRLGDKQRLIASGQHQDMADFAELEQEWSSSQGA